MDVNEIRADERQRVARFISELLPYLLVRGAACLGNGDTTTATIYEAVYVFTEGLVADVRRWDGEFEAKAEELSQ